MLRNALLSLFAVTLVAQTPAPEAKPEAPAKAEAPKAEAPKAEAPKEDKVLARVGNKVLRQSDFDLFLEMALPPQQKSLVASAPAMKEQYLKNYLDFQLLAAKAKLERVDAKESYKRRMALMEMQTLIQELMEKRGKELQDKAQPTEADIKAYFETNKDKFKTPEKFSARHILVGTKDNPRSNGQGLSDEDAKAKVAKIQAEMKAGKKFEDAAKEYTDDPGSKDKGGLYEDIAYGQFVPEFDAAVKKQEIGQVGEAIKSQFGYHIIKVEKKTPAEMPEFEKVKDQVKQTMLPERMEAVRKVFMDEIKKEVGFAEGPGADKGVGALKAPKAPKASKKAEGAAK